MDASVGKYSGDAALMKAVAQGRRAAVETLLDKYMLMVSRVSYRILCDRPDSDAVTLAVFRKLCRSASGFDGRQNLHEYLCRLMCSMCHIRMIRRRLLDLFYISPSLYETSDPLPHSPEEDYITKETWEIFCRASRNLTYRQRVVFALCEMEQLPMSEVEAVTGLSAGRIKEHIRAARKQIRAELEVYGKVR